MPKLDWRCVVAALDASGSPGFVSRGALAVTSEQPGVRVSQVLSLPRLPASVGDRALNGPTHVAIPGSVVVSAVILESGCESCTPWAPIPSLVWCVIVAGHVRVSVDSATNDDLTLTPGEVLIDEGGRATLQPCRAQPARILVAQFVPDETAKRPMSLALRRAARDDGPYAMRRVVVATSDGGTRVLAAGVPPVFLTGDRGEAIDVWQTGGPVAGAEQGGDADDWMIEPVGGGAKVLSGRLPASHDPGESGWHRTATIDVGVVISGSVEMHIRDAEPIVLGPGDIGIHHATEHRWVVASEEPLNRVTFLFALV
jgi:hypothetical protein